MKTQKTNNKTTTIPVKTTTKEKDVVKDIETEDGLLIKYLQTESTLETNIEANAVVSNEEETAFFSTLTLVSLKPCWSLEFGSATARTEALSWASALIQVDGNSNVTPFSVKDWTLVELVLFELSPIQPDTDITSNTTKIPIK